MCVCVCAFIYLSIPMFLDVLNNCLVCSAQGWIYSIYIRNITFTLHNIDIHVWYDFINVICSMSQSNFNFTKFFYDCYKNKKMKKKLFKQNYIRNPTEQNVQKLLSNYLLNNPHTFPWMYHKQWLFSKSQTFNVYNVIAYAGVAVVSVVALNMILLLYCCCMSMQIHVQMLWFARIPYYAVVDIDVVVVVNVLFMLLLLFLMM